MIPLAATMRDTGDIDIAVNVHKLPFDESDERTSFSWVEEVSSVRRPQARSDGSLYQGDAYRWIRYCCDSVPEKCRANKSYKR
jgi:hypothetical protein